MTRWALHTVALLCILIIPGRKAFGQTPSNNCDITAAYQLNVGTSCNPISYTIDSPLGAPNNPLCGFSLGTGEDGWGWFTATSSTTTVEYSNTNRDAMIFIYTDNGTPCAGLTQIDCVDDYGAGAGTESLTFPTTPGMNYYVRIVRYTGTSGTMGGTICVYSLPGNGNDPCDGAIPVSCGNTYTGTTVGATPDAIPAGCGSSASPGLWYTITGDGSIMTIDLCGSAYDTNLSLYEGGCGGLTCLQYNDDFCGLQSSITFSSTAGTVYYLLVHGFGAASGAFTMNIDCYTESANDPCGGALPVQCGQTVNGSTATFNPDIIPGGCGFSVSGGVWYSFIGTGDMVTASLCGSAYDTQISIFTGTCAGLSCINTNDDLCGLQSQVSFLSNVGTVYYILVHGTYDEGNFSLALTCEEFAPGPEDCAGAISICADTQFQGNSSGSGFSDDLNTTNAGCLWAENQTSWYVFQPLTTGTISFTINPTPIVDYDFAVWGPMAAPTCPPVGTPLRCSYSALYQATGLGNGATDFTEGAGGNAWVAPITVTSTDINAFYIMCLDNFSATTTPFVFDWSLSGVILNCGIMLPVELTEFTGREVGTTNCLNWTTASELNNERFEIWSSADGISFEKIGETAGHGTCQSEHHYQFVDRNPDALVTYYKLHQIDFNGSSQWSEVIVVTRTAVVTIAPNPVENILKVQCMASAGIPLTFQLTDISGRVIRIHHIEASEEGRLTEWDFSDIPSGLYQLNAYGQGGELVYAEKVLHY